MLWKENERLMLGLEKTSMDFIRKTHDKYEKKGMAFAVAFSGGKDRVRICPVLVKVKVIQFLFEYRTDLFFARIAGKNLALREEE